MLNIKTNLFLTYSTVLIIPLLITGSFIPDLVLSICVITYTYYLIKNNHFNSLKNYFYLFFLIFIISILISSIISTNIKSIISSIGYFRFLIFVSFISFMIQNSKKDLLLLIFYSIFFTYIFLLFEFSSQIVFKQTLFGNRILNYDRFIISSFYHEEIYSSFIVRTLPFFIGIFFLKKEKLSQFFKISFFIISLFLVLTVIINGERAALGLLFLIFLFLIIFLDFNLKFKLGIILSSLISIFIILGTISDTNFTRKVNGIKDFTNTIKNNLTANDSKRIIFSEKYDSLYKTSFNIYKEFPILGIGIKNFRHFCSDKKFAHNQRSCATHPHNIIAQILAETGTVGFIFYLFSVLAIIRVIFTNLKNNKINKEKKNYIICLICSLLISLWPLFPSGNIFNNWLSIIAFYPLGFLIHEINKSQKI